MNLFSYFLAATLLLADVTAPKDIQEIDRQIEYLTNRKNVYKSQADRHQDEGDRWQFTPGRLQDARDAWDQADEARAKMAILQQQIDALNKKKAEMIEQSPSNLQGDS